MNPSPSPSEPFAMVPRTTPRPLVFELLTDPLKVGAAFCFSIGIPYVTAVVPPKASLTLMVNVSPGSPVTAWSCQ